MGPPCPEPEPEPGGTWTPGGRRWPPLLPLLPLDPEDELPAFGFWFGPVGNEPCVLLLLLPPPPPRAIESEIGASTATPTVAVATSMTLSRFEIIVVPLPTLSSKSNPAGLTIVSVEVFSIDTTFARFPQAKAVVIT